ncbi:hypothetical protein DBR10_07400 [Caulobacter sp. HMWF025]|nr:hypothetical protein DBR10_07400 [Caulobacter sp. HMWF025]
MVVDRFYCGELSSKSQETKLNFFRLGEGIEDATWLGVVRAPTVQTGPPALAWCRERMAQDVNPATCRRDGNPAVPSGALRFKVVETLIGAPATEVEVSPRTGVRILLNTGLEGQPVTSACQQAFLTDPSGDQVYFSPAIVSLDPGRDYVLLLKPAANEDPLDPVVVPGTGPRIWAAAFALVERPDQVRRQVRSAVKAYKQSLNASVPKP